MALQAVPDALLIPIISGYTEAITPCVAFIVIGSILASMTLPILVILFYFSSPALKRQPVFILNILSLLGGWFLGMGNAYMEVSYLLQFRWHALTSVRYR